MTIGYHLATTATTMPATHKDTTFQSITMQISEQMKDCNCGRTHNNRHSECTAMISTNYKVWSGHDCFKQGLHHTHLPWPRPLPAVDPGLSLDAMPVLTEFTTTLMFLKSRGFAASNVEGSGGGPETRVCRYLH